MRTVDLQTVHTQTPAVERSYQTRPGQVEQELRQAEVLQQQAVDQKNKETQATEETEGKRIQQEKERERKRKQQAKKRQDEEAEQQENSAVKVKPGGRPGGIDITV
ncbi:hypothetical protein ACFL67_02320 [candidate division KSB1 bacterium]